MKMNRIIRTVLILFLIVAASYGFWWQLSQNKEKMEEQVRLATAQLSFVPVKVAEAAPASFQEAFTVNGTFEPSRELAVVSTVNGEIIESNIRPGTYVEKGSLMLVADHEYTQNELDAARLKLQKAEKDVERMAKLIGEGGVTQAQYEEAKVELESAKIKIQSLEKRLSDSFIRAPISGTISLLPRTQEPIVGAFLGQGMPICQIVNVRNIRLKVQLTEEQIVRVQEGLEVKVTADVYPNAAFTGRVTFVGVKSEIMSKRFPAEIELANSRDYPLRGGMNGKAHFQLGEQSAPVAVPRRAFAGSIREGKLYVVENEVARIREVQTGRIFGEQVEVLSGLSAGEQVVLSGQINLEDNTKVKIVE